MTRTAHEFDYLAEEASELGIDGPLPTVVRADVATPTGSVSALRWERDARLTFLHGGGLNAHTWDGTLLALAAPALAIDLPGHGASEWRDDFDYSPATTAGTIAGVLDSLGVREPQTVIGQSLGGLTGIALAGIRPDLVGALVIVDVSPGLKPGEASQVSDFLAGPQVFESREEIVEKALAAGIGSSRAALERGVVLNTRLRDDGTVVFLHHLANPPAGVAPLRVDFESLWAPLESSTVPVLLVRGTSGFLSEERVAEFRSRVPRARVAEVDAGHNVQEQQPAALADLIAGFVEEHGLPT